MNGAESGVGLFSGNFKEQLFMILGGGSIIAR
jgi:hypothetical protein